MNKKQSNKHLKPGLVICDKTDRKETFGEAFPTEQDIENVAQSFQQIGEPDPRKPSRHFVSISPGTVTVSKQSKIKKKKSPQYTSRKPIKEWSRKSRSNMVQVLCSLDYGPMFESGGLPALITLTYPKNFKTLCPNAQAGTRHLKLLRQRYERQYGKIRAIYKWEFMKSGSPHVHLYMVPPKDPGFKQWLSENWADIVGETDPDEYLKHLKAGTGVDYAKAFRSSDPKRIASYFSKHSSPNIGGQKEYQNQPPKYWQEAGSVGRFWGRWGLEKLVKTVEVTEEHAFFIARLLRKVNKANAHPRKVVVWRVRQKDGLVFKRKVNRKPKRMKGSQGFSSVNNTLTLGAELTRAVEARFGKTFEPPMFEGPKGSKTPEIYWKKLCRKGAEWLTTFWATLRKPKTTSSIRFFTTLKKN